MHARIKTWSRLKYVYFTLNQIEQYSYCKFKPVKPMNGHRWAISLQIRHWQWNPQIDLRYSMDGNRCACVSCITKYIASEIRRFRFVKNSRLLATASNKTVFWKEAFILVLVKLTEILYTLLNNVMLKLRRILRLISRYWSRIFFYEKLPLSFALKTHLVKPDQNFCAYDNLTNFSKHRLTLFDHGRK